jgi:hypothetical protein
MRSIGSEPNRTYEEEIVSELTQEQVLRQLSDQVIELATEVAVLRESIVTAAEWDNQARQNRQQLLDTTLASLRRDMRILVGVNLVLVGLMVWTLIQTRM